jgi:hypothetical protein
MSAEPTSLNCNEIVYRAILRKSQLDTSKIPPQPTVDNFILRSGENDGLSVGIASRCSPADVAGKFSKCHGMTSLHVGFMKDLGLNIVIDPLDETHALILGLPNEDDPPNEAEPLARALKSHARPVKWQN